MAIEGSERKMSRRVCWSTVRAVHYRSVQLGSNCSHDFNLSRDDEDGRISDLMLLSIKEEEGKRAKVVRNTEVVVVPLKIR